MLIGLVGLSGFGAGLRSIGIRVVLPLGGVPLLFGIEAAADVSFGAAGATLFLSSAGYTLILVNADVRLAGESRTMATFIRLTSGLSYFDLTRPLPSFVVGGGLAWEVKVGSAIGLGVMGELLYPIAFPVPLFTVSGRWLSG